MASSGSNTPGTGELAAAATTTTALGTSAEEAHTSSLHSRFDSVNDEHAILVPGMHDPGRTASRSSAVTSLVATMVGGGVLSLPYACARVGIVLGLCYLLVAGLISAFSIQLLLASSRRSGATSYEDVVLKSFGLRMKYVTMLLLIVMTFLACIAYLVLGRDLMVPLVESYWADHKLSSTWRNAVAVMTLLPVAPLCFAKSLNALRFTSLTSLLALMVLSAAIVVKTVNRETPVDVNKIEWASASIDDSLYSMPFMQLSFMCHFNVLPVHVGLRKPTKARLNCVVYSTIMCSMVFYLVVSVFGYLYAYDHVCGPKSSSTCTDGVPDNILNAFDLHDGLIDFGRFCFLVAVMLSFPLLVLPCRETLIRLMRELHVSSSDADSDSDFEYTALDDPALLDDGQTGGRIFPLETPGGEELNIIDSPESPEFRTPMLRRQRRRFALRLLRPFKPFSKQGLLHIVVTSAILVLSVVLMFAVPGVSVVWNLTGSSVSMLLGFVIPSSSYISLRSPGGFFERPSAIDRRFVGAWGLLVISSITGVVCTLESLKQVFG